MFIKRPADMLQRTMVACAVAGIAVAVVGLGVSAAEASASRQASAAASQNAINSQLTAAQNQASANAANIEENEASTIATANQQLYNSQYSAQLASTSAIIAAQKAETDKATLIRDAVIGTLVLMTAGTFLWVKYYKKAQAA